MKLELHGHVTRRGEFVTDNGEAYPVKYGRPWQLANKSQRVTITVCVGRAVYTGIMTAKPGVHAPMTVHKRHGNMIERRDMLWK